MVNVLDAVTFIRRFTADTPGHPPAERVVTAPGHRRPLYTVPLFSAKTRNPEMGLLPPGSKICNLHILTPKKLLTF